MSKKASPDRLGRSFFDRSLPPSLTCQASLRLNFGRSDSPDPGLGLLCPLSSSPNLKKFNPFSSKLLFPRSSVSLPRKLGRVGASSSLRSSFAYAHHLPRDFIKIGFSQNFARPRSPCHATSGRRAGLASLFPHLIQSLVMYFFEDLA